MMSPKNVVDNAPMIDSSPVISKGLWQERVRSNREGGQRGRGMSTLTIQRKWRRTKVTVIDDCTLRGCILKDPPPFPIHSAMQPCSSDGKWALTTSFGRTDNWTKDARNRGSNRTPTHHAVHTSLNAVVGLRCLSPALQRSPSRQ